MSHESNNNPAPTPFDDETLIKAFDLMADEVFEARYNLLGFYSTLQKIKWRLEKEGKL